MGQRIAAGIASGTIAEDALKQSIADSPAFQAFVNEPDAEGAKDHIFIDDLTNPANGYTYEPDELQELRPFALIFCDEDDGFQLNWVGTASSYLDGGTMKVTFEAAKVLGTQEDAYQMRDFKNHIFLILDEISEESHVPGHLVRPDIACGPISSEKEERENSTGEIFCVDVSFSWNIAAGGGPGGGGEGE